ncbi:DUF6161 domain-containing protein [Thermomonas fusca]
MSEQTSPLLSSPLEFLFTGMDVSQTFERVSDIIEWAEREMNAWTDAKPKNNRLAQVWNTQRSSAQTIHNSALALEALLLKPDEARTEADKQSIRDRESNIRHNLNSYNTGDLICKAHPHFGTIQALAETDADAGAALLCACLNKGNDLLSHTGQLDAIARIGALSFIDGARKKTIKALRDDLSALKKNAEIDTSILRATIDEHSQNTKANLQEHKDAVEAREQAWNDLLEKCDKDWIDLKRVYDEKLALLAPTEYWNNRARNHRKKAIGFAVAFAAALTAALWLFTYFGVSHLAQPGTQSTLLAVIPVLVPAFAGVWVLRILGRLLSENLAIIQDAQERETMVKTFLALMRDETTGKSVVTDEDRRIILHALFRASTVTATDDTPPLNWLDAAKKLGSR